MARTQTQPDPPAAATHRIHAQELESRSNYAGAITEYQQAYSLDRDTNLYDSALDLNNIGGCYHRISQNRRALDYLEKALPLVQQMGDNRRLAKTLNSIGTVYASLGQYDRALDIYQQALTVVEWSADKEVEAETLSNIGAIYEELSQYSKSLDFYARGLSIERQFELTAELAQTLDGIGSVYLALYQFPMALRYCREALPLRRQYGDKSLEAVTLSNIASAYAGSRRFAEALDFYAQALALERKSADAAGEAVTLGNLGAVYQGMNQFDKALDNFQQSLHVARQVGNKTSEIAELNNIGALYDARHDYIKALDFYGQLLPLARQIGDKSGEAETLSNIMFSWKSLNGSRVAIFYGKQAVNLLQSIRGNISALGKQSQKSYLAANQNTYRTLADLLIGQGRLTEAQQVLRLLKEREFYDFLNPDPVAPVVSREDQMIQMSARTAQATTMMTEVQDLARRGHLAEARQLANKISELTDPPPPAPPSSPDTLSLTPREERWKSIYDKTTPEQTAQVATMLTTVQPTAVQQQIAAAFSGPCTSDDKLPQAAEAGDLQRALPPKTAALYTIVAPDRLIIILVTHDKQKAYSSPITADVLYNKVLAFRRALVNTDKDPAPLAAELYKLVLGPVQRDLDGAEATTLLFSLDDALRYIPPAALYDPDRKEYLAERYQTALIALGTSPQAVRSSLPPAILGLGVSKKQGSLPPLPGVRHELMALIHEPTDTGGLLPGRHLLDVQFTQAALEASLKTGGYAFVHVASHFSLQGTEATSFLLLGDGNHLSVAALAKDPRRFRGVELLTLSACDTAMEVRRSSGREVEGIATLAQSLGAKAVLASLWPVSDAATPPLMCAFYGYRRAHPQASLAKALQAAQLSLLHKPLPLSADADRRGTENVSAMAMDKVLPPFVTDSKAPYAHPFYWAPFILIGNWR